jgi:O-antigen ligase
MDLYKMIFWGIVSSIISFHFFGPLLSAIPFYRQAAQNGYAFILIIFGPLATAYLHESKKNMLYTFGFIALLTVSGFLSGSRSGSLLTLIGSLAVIYLNNRKNLLIMTYLGLLLLVAAPNLLEIPGIKNTIRGLNDRTYSIIYETQETLETDRSYLTRLALIEKGLSIFDEHPLTGVGIGNFTKVDYEIQYNFEGAELLENKENDLSISTSAHNSYVSILSEGGLFLLLPALYLMFYPIFYYIIHFNEIKGLEGAMFIAITMMCIHAWFISGMMNVFGWFLLALANSYIIHNQSKHTRWF